jgi:3-dehydroquinate dehydratase-1
VKNPLICASITKDDIGSILKIEPEVDMFEVRLDMVGSKWPGLVKQLKKPWIACNRTREEGGKAPLNETERIEELIRAAQAGAGIVDIEYQTKNLKEIVPVIKSRAQCLISYHDVSGTPSFKILAGIIEGQLKAGADICKIVTTAREFADNLTTLKIIREFPEAKIIAFAMGESGQISRILCPLAGGYLTYACIARGQEAASGQLTVNELKELFRYVKDGKF